MITLIGGEKGGSGKSTVATNLAVWLAHAGKDVLLLDTDQQRTAALWATERGEHPELPPVHCVQRQGNVFGAIKDLGERYEEIVIDAGGRDSEELRSAMVAADRLYCPLRPSQSDLWTVEHVTQLVKMARAMNPNLLAHAVLTMVPTNRRVNEAAEAKKMLSEFSDLRLCDTQLSDRKAFRDAMCSGGGVIEMDDTKAASEMEAFAQEVYGGQIQIQAAS